MDMEMAAHRLGKDKPKHMKKHLKELHVKEAHTGGYMVHKHDGKGGVTEHVASDLDQVHDHMEDHMGQPNDGEEMEPQAEAEPQAAPMMAGA
jgi:hypothetical protein